MLDFKDEQIKTAGAYVLLNGQFLFTLGWIPHNGNYPVVRLGGHREANETGWECAAREVAEEAGIQIRPVLPDRTYLVLADNPDLTPKEIPWPQEIPGEVNPYLVAAYDIETEPRLSLMYLAESNETPAPCTEVKGLLFLDEQNIQQICHEKITLGEYLKAGGRAIFSEPFDEERCLEPFIQLRILSRLLNNRRILPENS